MAECAVGPLFAQVTVSPWSMVIEAGEKLKSAIATEPLAAAIALGFGAGALVALVGEELGLGRS